MEVTSLGYRTDIALLQLGGSRVEDRGDHIVVCSPHNPHHWWGNFLLLAEAPEPDVSQSWLDRFAAEFPEAEHVALGVDGTSGRASDLRWFTAHDFEVNESAVMTATAVHEPATGNSEAIYRRLHTDEDWVQSIDLRVRCNDRPLDPVVYRAYETVKARTNRLIVEHGHGAWSGAFLDDRLVSQMGLVVAGTGLARFQSVETDPDFRRRGLAGSLVHHVSRLGFDELAVQTLVMVADPDYFAIDLYRSVGFVATETQLQIERPPRRVD